MLYVVCWTLRARFVLVVISCSCDCAVAVVAVTISAGRTRATRAIGPHDTTKSQQQPVLWRQEHLLSIRLFKVVTIIKCIHILFSSHMIVYTK